MHKKKIGFIGAGNMASSLIGGLLTSKAVTPDDILFYQPSRQRAERTQARFGIELAATNKALVANADTVVIATKPQTFPELLAPLSHVVGDNNPLLISVAAGVRTTSMEKYLRTDCCIVRAMPNTPALIGLGATGLYANERTSKQQKATATQLFSTIGETAWVDNEADIDTITALSGSGPAYFMTFLFNLIEAAVNAGLDREVAQRFALQTAIGSAHMVQQSDVPLQQLIDNVTSPKGTTAAALAEFTKADLPVVVNRAFTAAKRRSEELEQALH